MLRRACLVAAILLLSLPAFTQNIDDFAKKLTVKTFANGLTVLIYERHEAPVFSYTRMVDVGDTQDPMGASGLAHMFEHMAFKGTEDIGTTNYATEKLALDREEKAYEAYDAERRKRVGADPAKVKELYKAFEAAAEDAHKYVIPNQFTEILEREGAVGVNAYTSMDETAYLFSMPSNRLELWAYMEADRMAHPVFREFYKERDVVLEERRMRVDSNPNGRMVEQFQAAAYVAHPYHRSGIGWPSEVTSLTATQAKTFYKKYYTPSNTVIALVGDIYPKEAMPLLEKYFGALPTEPKPSDLDIAEPPQFDTRSVVIHDKAQPIYIEGYHRPDYRDPDDAVYDVIEDLISNGRTSRLYRSLVRDQHIAAYAAGFTGFPGHKYPNLFALYGVPMPGHKPDEIADGIHKEIERLKNEDVTDDELQMIKTRFRAQLIESLGSNEGLAQSLAQLQLRYGDWKQLFGEIDRTQKVTKADIRRVANKVFVASNRTTAEILTITPTQKPVQQNPGENTQEQQ